MKTCLRILAVSALLSSSAALAQIDVHVGLPRIHFEVVPPMVVVSPGVQVVEDYDDEVFFVDRHYYVRHGEHWYRTRDHRGHWVRVEHRHVPVHLVKSPRGKYRRYRRHHRDVHVVHESPRHESRRVVYVKEKDHDHDRGHGHHGKGKGHGKKHKHKDRD